MVDAQGCHVHAKRVNHHLPLLCKSRPNCCIWRSLGRRHWQQDGQHWGLGEFCLIFQNWQHFFPVGFRSDSRGHVWSPLWAATHHAWPDWAWSGLWVPGKPLSCDLGWQLWDFQCSAQINTMLIRFTSFARALAGNISPFASRSDSGLPPCSSYWLPPMPGATSSWCLIVFLQLLCLLHHAVHRGMLCLPDSHHLHNKGHHLYLYLHLHLQGGGEHDQNRLQLPHQSESVPLPSWKLHRPIVRRLNIFRSDLTLSWQGLVESNFKVV